MKYLDEVILSDLPGYDPNWLCKVEDGYIKNLKGEKKNKILTIIIQNFVCKKSINALLDNY